MALLLSASATPKCESFPALCRITNDGRKKTHLECFAFNFSLDCKNLSAWWSVYTTNPLAIDSVSYQCSHHWVQFLIIRGVILLGVVQLLTVKRHWSAPHRSYCLPLYLRNILFISHPPPIMEIGFLSPTSFFSQPKRLNTLDFGLNLLLLARNKSSLLRFRFYIYPPPWRWCRNC